VSLAGTDECSRRLRITEQAQEMSSESDQISVHMAIVGGQLLRVARKHASSRQPPLLMFNGIGANLELAFPFMRAFKDTEAVIFDVPGVGGSPAPMAPYRPSTIARLARDLALKLKLGPRIDVAGVSWGGGLAQRFARQYPQICRRLVLIATAPGVAMVPGHPSVLLKMASPRRYADRGYMRSIAADLYGGAFRKDPTLIGRHADAMKGATKY